MSGQKWTVEETKTLYDLKNNFKLAYSEISEKLNRSISSVSKKYKNTNWKKFLKENQKIKESKIVKEITIQTYIDNLVRTLILTARNDYQRLNKITKKEFLSNNKLPSKTLPITFTELKRRASYELKQIGFSYPSSTSFKKGTYIIVGDSHGKHTRTGMFNLLKNLSNFIGADKIIHVGHFIDDDNTFNCNWEKFENLCIIAGEEELKFFSQKYIDQINSNQNNNIFNIVREKIFLGNNLTIQNQNLITDYVQTPLSSGIYPEYFETSTISNLHRHEYDTRCTREDEFSYIASPGCLCEKHIKYTIKQQDFTNGRTVKLTFPTGYHKYRRMKHMYQTWQQGCIIVEVDESGDCHTHMCRIHKTSKGFTTSYFDKIITENKILDPDDKTMAISDAHVDKHDKKVIDISEQIAKKYKPKTLINLGDFSGNEPLNHHIFEKIHCEYIDKSVLEKSAINNFILNRIYKWADVHILILGNHERFYVDFFQQHPQFKDILDFKFINGIQDLDIEIIPLKKLKDHNNVTYLHGEMRLCGQKGGSKVDKIFRTFGQNTVSAHCHYPSCRRDCYTVGLLGKKDLDYNEPDASKWAHSVILSNSFEDQVFISNILIEKNKSKILNQTFTPTKNYEEKWTMPKFKARIRFEFGN